MAKNKQNLVKRKVDPLKHILVTKMQRRFVDCLIYHEGRTTRREEALQAGNSDKYADEKEYKIKKKQNVVAY